MVGRLARMRVSSVMRTFLPRVSIGTLKSTRTRTRFPRTSRSRSVSFAILLPLVFAVVLVLEECSHTISENDYANVTKCLFSQKFEQFHATVAVAPFVVVPTDHFHKPVAKHERQLAIKNTGVRITNDVLRNERLITVFDHAFVGFI